MVTVALIQSDIRPHDIEDNLTHYEVLLKDKIQEPVDLIVFPEMFNCGFSADFDQHAEPMEGRSVTFLQKMAQRYNCDAVATLPIRDGEKIVNRLIWMSPDCVRGWYDKKHLFFGSEQRICTSGDKLTIVESSGQRWLPLICYDVRFPVWSRNAVQDGQFLYDCLIYTANFPEPREQVLLKLATARAIENQAYVLVVNRIGYDGEGHAHAGGTAVISPQGEILAQTECHQEEVLMYSLDFESLRQYRASFPVSKQWD